MDRTESGWPLMGRIQRYDYLWDRGWKLHSGLPGRADSYWIKPSNGKIFIRRVAYQIQRGDEKRTMEKKFQ